MLEWELYAELKKLNSTFSRLNLPARRTIDHSSLLLRMNVSSLCFQVSFSGAGASAGTIDGIAPVSGMPSQHIVVLQPALCSPVLNAGDPIPAQTQSLLNGQNGLGSSMSPIGAGELFYAYGNAFPPPNPFLRHLPHLSSATCRRLCPCLHPLPAPRPLLSPDLSPQGTPTIFRLISAMRPRPLRVYTSL